MADEKNSVIITLDDIYHQLVEVKKEIAAMTPQAEKLADHETRLRTMERWRYALPISVVIAMGEAIALINNAKH